jgi:hypothetical protein
VPTIDRTTKAALVAIAVGLWMNVGVSLLHPSPASAQSMTEQQLDNILEAVRDTSLATGRIELDLLRLSDGTCSNHKLC